MAIIDVLKHLSFDGFTAKERSELRKKFQAYRRDLQVAIRAVNRGLALIDKPRAAGAGKKKAGGRSKKKS